MDRIKVVVFGLVWVLFVLMVQCTSQKKVPMTYEFPPVMKDYVRVEFTRQCEKGQVLYDIKCAKCHNVQVKRKLVIPDFTSEQLNSYDMRMANPQHESDLTSVEVTTEELGYIISFLSYKKRSNVPASFPDHK